MHSNYGFISNKRLCILLALCLVHAVEQCHAVVLVSPNDKVRLVVELMASGDKSQLAYSVGHEGQPVMDRSTIQFTDNRGVVVGSDLEEAVAPVTEEVNEQWRPVYGERSVVDNHYRQLTWLFTDKPSSKSLKYEFRCYDAGIAFRTTICSEDANEAIEIRSEQSQFCFLEDHPAWCTSSAQGKYDKRPISKIGGEVDRPLVVQLADNKYVALGEAGLVDYARMRLLRDGTRQHSIKSKLSSSVKSSGELATPWRVIMVANSAGQLLEHNDLFLNLNEPCAIEDTSWIKPGKVIRDYTLTNEGARACIDFAAKYKLEYVEFDAGWYGHEYDDSSDATTVSVDPQRSKGPFDFPEILAYAKQRGIKVIVYVNRRALEKQLDDLLPLYRGWGISGVKYGFVNVGSQKWTTWLHDAVRKAADHQLMVDVHDEYRPTGYSRTYPNLMTQEGVRGDEASPSSEQALTTLFTRCVAGASDHTVCYFDRRVSEKWTHGHQLAKAVCMYSPWQFLFWYDTPLQRGDKRNRIIETPELVFFSHVPTTWDETKVIHGQIGEHAVIARRSGREWYIGGMNNSQPRTLEVPLRFLPEDHTFVAQLFEDDESIDTVTKVRVTSQQVGSESVLRLSMSSNGGFAVRITPEKDSDALSKRQKLGSDSDSAF